MSAPSDAEFVAPTEVERLRDEGVALVDLRTPEAFIKAPFVWPAPSTFRPPS